MAKNTTLNSRYLLPNIRNDLESKMVLLAGPRQVGKTTLALSLLKDGGEQHPAYLNWDYMPDKQGLIRGNIPSEEPLLILDEIHKYPDWRNLIKGLYDKHRSTVRFLITGSAKLDYYSYGGDSLQGRYFFYRLHPLSLRELDSSLSRSTTNILLKFGGFPEPLLNGQEDFWRRWQNQRVRKVIQDDLNSLEEVKSIELIKLLAEILPTKVSSPLSIKSLREDLKVAHKTVERWISILENLYYCFRIPPYGPPKVKAVKKEQKLYLWDWSLCKTKDAIFENMIASHLLKYCHWKEDTQGYKMELRYIRDIYGKEIDFVVLQDENPVFAVECKSGDKEVSKHIKYMATRSDIPDFYQVHLAEKDYLNAEFRTRVLPFEQLIKTLKIP